MALMARAVYEAGKLRLLDKLDLSEGQHVNIIVEQKESKAAIQAALGDLIRPSNPALDPHPEVEAMADEIFHSYTGDVPMSEIIIQERQLI